MPLDSSETGISRTAHRVGDVQRAACAETLTDAFVQGELTREELDARTELCFTAVTDLDLHRITSDLAARPSTAPAAAATPTKDIAPAAVSLPKLVVLEVVLVFLAYVLGVDLESELRAWYVIALEIWVVGSAAGFAGAFLLRSSGGSRAVEQR